MFRGHSLSPSLLTGFPGISHCLTSDLSFVPFFLLQVHSVIVGVGGDPGPQVSACSSNSGPDLGTDGKDSALNGLCPALNTSTSYLFTQNTDFFKVVTIVHNWQAYKNVTHQEKSKMAKE